MVVLYRGLLNEETPFYMRSLRVNELEDVLNIQREVIEALENKNTLSMLSKEEFLYILSGSGSLIGVFVAEQLIAFRATLVPEIDDEHLGYDIGLETSALSTVLYQEISCVSLRYRGHGLQRLMADVLMEQLQTRDFTYVCATVAPFNIPSLKDKFSQQMEVAALKKKYGGKLRYVFVKHLREERKLYEVEQLIPMSDTFHQQKVLSDGWRGTSMVESTNGWLLRYEK